MALPNNAVATITLFPYPKGIDNTQRMQIIRGTITLANSTSVYPKGGIPLSWQNISNVDGESLSVFPNTANGPFPIEVDVFSANYAASASNIGPGPSGYIYTWDSVQGNLHILEVVSGNTGFSGPLVEFVTGQSIPAGVLNDAIQFTAIFAR